MAAPVLVQSFVREKRPFPGGIWAAQDVTGVQVAGPEPQHHDSVIHPVFANAYVLAMIVGQPLGVPGPEKILQKMGGLFSLESTSFEDLQWDFRAKNVGALLGHLEALFPQRWVHEASPV